MSVREDARRAAALESHWRPAYTEDDPQRALTLARERVGFSPDNPTAATVHVGGDPRVIVTYQYGGARTDLLYAHHALWAFEHDGTDVRPRCVHGLTDLCDHLAVPPDRRVPAHSDQARPELLGPELPHAATLEEARTLLRLHPDARDHLVRCYEALLNHQTSDAALREAVRATRNLVRLGLTGGGPR